MHRHGVDSLFPFRPQTLDVENLQVREVEDAATIADFAYWLGYNYNFGISAYGTGSMSQKVSADEMIYCPMGAVPDNMAFPLHRVSFAQAEKDTLDMVRAQAEQVEGVRAVETLRVRKTGLEYLVDIHIEVDSHLSVGAGHEIGHRVKDSLMLEFPVIQDVLVHIEPFPHHHNKTV